MLRNLSVILKLDATTGGERIGAVDDIIFDQVVWTARHVVVSVGGWLRRKKAIVPRQAVTLDIDAGRAELNVTRSELAYSVGVTESRLVGRDRVATSALEAATAGLESSGSEPLAGERRQEVLLDPDLRSAGTVMGFAVQGEDGRLGYVEDFIMDDETWIIQSLVVSARRWLPSRSVLLPVPWVDRVERDGRYLVSRLPQRALRDAPDYDANAPVDPKTLDAYWEQYRRAEER